MIKIMHVISDSNIGGAGRYLLTYLANTDRSAFEPVLVVPQGSKLIPEAEKLGVRVLTADGLAEKSYSIQADRQLQKLFRIERPAIVHSHASFSARRAAKAVGGIKIVYTRHSVFPQKSYLTKGPGKWLNGKIGDYLADRIIAVAEAAKKNLTDTGIDASKIEVIYNGVNPLQQRSEEENAALRKQYGITDEFIVGILARLEDIKGHKYLIDAFKILKQRGRKAKLIIAGTGGVEEELKAQIKFLGLGDMVVMAGFVADVEGLVNLMDMQANASYGTEAASLALMEGMSLGKPTVASDFGGNPELVNNRNGIVVPQKNALALADAIEKIMMDDALYRELSEGAKHAYETRFTAKIMTENMENFYRRLVQTV